MEAQKKAFYNLIANIIYVSGLSIPLFITLGRILIPDTAYDSINYHTFLGIRGWNFLKFSQLEFYPATNHSFFPFFNMINEIGRSIAGYRLGTFVQTIFYYLLIFFTRKIILLTELQTNNKIIDAILFVNIFISLEGLFQLSTYYVDIISSVFIFLCLYFYLLYKKRKKSKYLYLSTFFVSFSFLCKSTNYIYLIPYGLLMIFDLSIEKKAITKRLVSLIKHAVIYLLVNIPWMLWSYANTKNPFYPYFNNIFRSPYAAEKPFSFPLGANNFLEMVFYPFVTFFDNRRLGRIQGLITDYKFGLYIIMVFAACYLFYKRRKEHPLIWVLYKYSLGVYICWVAVFGYTRYAIAFEFMLGILIFALSSFVVQSKRKFDIIITVLFLTLIVLQDIHFVKSNLKYDYSWRPNLWLNKNEYLQELHNINTNKYNIKNISNSEFFLNCGDPYPALGYMVPSNLSDLPVLSLQNYENAFDPYQQAALRYIISKVGKSKLKFISIIKEHGMDVQPQKDTCLKRLQDYEVIIEDSQIVDFLGYKGQKLHVVQGIIDFTGIASDKMPNNKN